MRIFWTKQQEIINELTVVMNVQANHIINYFAMYYISAENNVGWDNRSTIGRMVAQNLLPVPESVMDQYAYGNDKLYRKLWQQCFDLRLNMLLHSTSQYRNLTASILENLNIKDSDNVKLPSKSMLHLFIMRCCRQFLSHYCEGLQLDDLQLGYYAKENIEEFVPSFEGNKEEAF